MNNFISAAVGDFGIGDAALTAVLGYVLVFCGLTVLMAVICIMAEIFKAKDKKNQEAAAKAEEAPASSDEAKEETPSAPLAPGSAGHVKLFDVPDKEAAMIMAIVADRMHKPLNELHFISIKEIK